MAPHPAQSLLVRESRITPGVCPRSLTGEPLEPCSCQLAGDAFLLRGLGDHYFHYRKDHGLTVERGPGAVVAEEGLWLAGSVYAAIASLNGLMPLHASAVAFAGRVFAFTGPAGAGKSTLIAALGQHDLPMFCDDTLVLDLSDPARIICLPGHKRLKLSDEALRLTGADRQEAVGGETAKFYARPPAGDVAEALPLAALVFLDDGEPAHFAAVSAGDRLGLLQDDHYTRWIHLAATGSGRVAQFDRMARMARQVAMARFVRPRDSSLFARDAALAARYVRELP